MENNFKRKHSCKGHISYERIEKPEGGHGHSTSLKMKLISQETAKG